MANVDSIVYAGITYRRYPDSHLHAARSYYTPGQHDKSGGYQALHREIWKAAHGPIPVGHHIHHADGNPLNNDLENLVCVEASEHQAIHTAWRRESGFYYRPAIMQALSKAREAAKAWHSSPEGLAWHSDKMKAQWAEQAWSDYECQHCGEGFMSRNLDIANIKFCSNNCKSAARRASGVDDIMRPCSGCGTEFRVNRYSKRKWCSRWCSRIR